MKETINYIIEYWAYLLLILIFAIIYIRVKSRGFFWLDRERNELSFKEFIGRWKKGVEGITPKQQSLTSLWGFPLIFGGIFTGIIINIIHRQYWLILLLVGSLPITIMQVVSLWQKYIAQKKAEEMVKQAMENTNE